MVRLWSVYNYGPITVISHDTGQDGHSMTVIAGCGGIVEVIMLSAIGFCTRYLINYYIYIYLIIVNVIFFLLSTFVLFFHT